jgi:hypothetical protein
MRSGGAVVTMADELAARRGSTANNRALAAVVRARTEQKGKALFHPMRLVLTGRPEGPELDLAVPAIDRGAELAASAGIPAVKGNRERAAEFVRALDALIPNP